MSQYANNITQKCQKSAKAFLDNEGLSFITDPSTQILTGVSNEEILLPAVVCQCATASAATQYEGNWSATLRIEVHSNSYDEDGTQASQDNHHERASEVFSKFMTDIPSGRQNLSNEEVGFTAQQVLPTEQGFEVRGNAWVSFLILQVECAGTYFDVS